jgi:hypothetical protein
MVCRTCDRTACAAAGFELMYSSMVANWVLTLASPFFLTRNVEPAVHFGHRKQMTHVGDGDVEDARGQTFYFYTVPVARFLQNASAEIVT